MFLDCFHYFSTGAEVSSIQAPLGDSPIQKIVVNRDFVKDYLMEIFKDTEMLHVNLDVTFIGNNNRMARRKRERGLVFSVKLHLIFGSISLIP